MTVEMTPWYSSILDIKEVKSVADVAKIPDGTLVTYTYGTYAKGGDVWGWAKMNKYLEIVQAIHDASVHGWSDNSAVIFRQGHATSNPASYYAWIAKRRSDALSPKAQGELYYLIAGFGDWICEQCSAGSHEQCCGWGGKSQWGYNVCLCKKQEHDIQKASDMAYECGIERLRAMRL